MVRAVTKLKVASNPTTTFFCLSNANAVFISTILEVCPPHLNIIFFFLSEQSKGLQNLFEEIVTNPAEFDPSGLLKLRRRVDPDGPQHGCTVGCSPNMCKGDSFILPFRTLVNARAQGKSSPHSWSVTSLATTALSMLEMGPTTSVQSSD